MIHADQLKAMPAGHEFARGEKDVPQLSDEPIRWVAIWSGHDWRVRVSPASRNYREVAQKGRVVDRMDIVREIQPASEEAMKLYFK